MRLLAAVQSILALAFILFGVVALFGIGITGLGFLVLGGMFALTAGIVAEQSRAGAAVALAADAVLAYMAVRKLAALFASETTGSKLQNVGFFDYMPAIAVLVLVGLGAFAVINDWRTVRAAAWF